MRAGVSLPMTTAGACRVRGRHERDIMCEPRTETKYVFDGNGMRVKKSTGTLYWRSPGGAVLAESDLSGNISNEYVFFAGRRIARRDSSGNVFYFFAYHLGTTHTVTNSTGTPCYDASFTPYGQEVLNPNVTSTCPPNYKFTGYEMDSETGNFYAMARYYSPRFGRFLSPDPAGVASASFSDPQTGNLYAYVRNSVLSLTDPLGLIGDDNCTNFGTGDMSQTLEEGAGLTAKSSFSHVEETGRASVQASALATGRLQVLAPVSCPVPTQSAIRPPAFARPEETAAP